MRRSLVCPSPGALLVQGIASCKLGAPKVLSQERRGCHIASLCGSSNALHNTNSVSFVLVRQLISSPTINNWVAFKQSLCYLKGALGRGLLYSNYECFSDVDRETSNVDTKYIIMSLLKEIQFHGEVRSRMQCFNLLQSLNIELWHNLCVTQYRYPIYRVQVVSSLHQQQNCSMIILFMLPLILCFMKQNKRIKIDCHFV